MILNRRFGDYVLVQKIATGGMAEIFLARKCGPGAFEKIVTMKTILAGRAENELYQRMFQNEAEIAARFNHPNVVQLYDVVQVGSTDAMVLEYMPGHTVAEVAAAATAKGAPLTRDMAVWIVAAACEGLHYVHTLRDWDGTELGIVHRDISPENLQITYDGVVKVFDFGIAHISLHEQDIELQGAMAGKYAYMSPEQCRGDAVDARADVWSMGVVLWELTTGQRLFRRDDPIHIINAVMEDPIPRPGDSIVDYPRFLERVVMKALDRDPTRRHASCAELRTDLTKFLKVNALKPDRDKLAALMGELFQGELEAFRGSMREVRLLPMPAAATPLPSVPAEAEVVLDEDDIQRSINQALNAEKVREENHAEKALEMFSSNGFPAVERPTAPLSVQNSAGYPSLAAGPTPLPATPTPAPPMPMPHTGVHGAPSSGARWVVVVGLVGLVLLVGAIAAGGAIFLTATPNETATAAEPEALPTAGALSVGTTPPGATISLDGRVMSVKSPAQIPGLPLGTPVVLTVEMEGFEPVQREVEFTAQEALVELDLKLEKVQTPQDSGPSGSLQLSTIPADVVVYIDGKKRAEETPVTLDRLGAGAEHVLRITREGHLDEIFAFTVGAGELKDLEIEMQPAGASEMGRLSIGSEPSRMRVEIDGEFVGRSDIQGLSLPAGEPIEVVVTDPKLGRWERRVVLRGGTHKEIKAYLGLAARMEPKDTEPEAPEDVLKGKATLTVTTKPPTQVRVRGKVLGQTPMTDLGLRPGVVTVAMTSEEPRISFKQTVTLEAGKTASIDMTIPSGKVSVSSEEPAEVYIDGAKVGDTPLKATSLYSGTHRVRVRSAAGSERVYVLRIRGGEDRSIVARFAKPAVAKAEPVEPAPEPEKAVEPVAEQAAEAPGKQGGADKSDKSDKADKAKASAKKKKDALANEPYPLLK